MVISLYKAVHVINNDVISVKEGHFPCTLMFYHTFVRVYKRGLETTDTMQLYEQVIYYSLKQRTSFYLLKSMKKCKLDGPWDST